MRTPVALVALIVSGWIWVMATPRVLARPNHDPDAARFVTSDLDNFWGAYMLATAADTTAAKEKIYQREYFDKGSSGLKDFLRLRIKSAHDLARATESSPKYYASLKEVTPRVAQMEPAIRTSFRKLKELYGDAVFPDVYFVIGVMNSGGTTAGSGLLIGVEMHGKTPDTDMSEMDNWLKAVLGPVDKLPAIVSHELTHYQQGSGGRTLLGQSIHEGTGDFIGERISSMSINEHLRAYGDAHEAELWREFRQAMNGNDTSKWLYQGDKSKDRPADLGYYMGCRIAQSYYDHVADKKKAIREILTASNFPAFLRDSHYADKFP